MKQSPMQANAAQLDILESNMDHFTKGPWEAKPSKYRTDTFIVQAGLPSMRVLASFDGDGDGYDEIDEANASLIAAAPDLLEALQDMVRAGQKQDWAAKYGMEMASAYNAIAKATGAA